MQFVYISIIAIVRKKNTCKFGANAKTPISPIKFNWSWIFRPKFIRPFVYICYQFILLCLTFRNGWAFSARDWAFPVLADSEVVFQKAKLLIWIVCCACAICCFRAQFGTFGEWTFPSSFWRRAQIEYCNVIFPIVSVEFGSETRLVAMLTHPASRIKIESSFSVSY